jgi:DNA-binding IclR family transcriptional regulator
MKTQTAPAVDRALFILELVARSQIGLTLPELVEQSQLPRSSVHYLLVTLERRGYLHRSERTSRYLFGTKLLHLAHASLSGLSVRQQAVPHLWGLMQATRLSAHLAILERNEVVLVAKVDPPYVTGRATWIGKRIDMHCTSLGKVLMANLPMPMIDRLVEEHGLPKRNENTICSVRRLKDELLKAVQLGYALNDEEDELGMRCIGVPVISASGEILAAISVAGTTSEITFDHLPSLLPPLRQAALHLGRALEVEGASVARGMDASLRTVKGRIA